MRKTNLWAGLSSVFIVLFAILIPMCAVAWEFDSMINGVLGVQTNRLVEDPDAAKVAADYYKSDYGDVELLARHFNNKDLNAAEIAELEKALAELVADEDEFAAREMTEGAVLLRNNDNALPLTQAEPKVSLFGLATHSPYYRATSGGAPVEGPRLVDLKSALTGQGISYGPLSDRYSSSEPKKSEYESRIASDCDGYTDAAIVMLKRQGGEGSDIARGGLALTANEKGMLEAIRDSKKFDKTILLVNSSHAMELHWLDEYEIDACLWIGGPGLKGFNGVAQILKGTAYPSGHLVDTYATDSMSSPAMVNWGDYAYTNADEVTAFCEDEPMFTQNYLVQAEGIYTGYRYYETRYNDVIENRGGANSSVGASASSAGWNYAQEVAFPFGYGLDYTSFTQSLTDMSYDSAAGSFTFNVRVTNSGNAKGKDVVQLYAQVPYTTYDIARGVEKSAIQLVGFAKTKELEAGEFDDVTITVDKYLLASYDSTAHDGEGGYILDDGTYYFSIGNGVHEALNNILAKRGFTGLTDHNGNAAVTNDKNVAEWKLENFDSSSYMYSQNNERESVRVENRFASVDLNYWIDNGVTYLSRNNWVETYPQEAVSVTATAAMMAEIDGYLYEKPDDAPTPGSFAQGIDRGSIPFVTMKDVPYDNELWDKFIDQLTVEEMAGVLIDYLGTEAVTGVNKPAQINGDGPDGVKESYFNGDSATCYVNEVVAASTWNVETLKERGKFLGEDCLFSGVSQLWSPGANLHRTPFSGRNFEYYSECGIMSYLCLAAQVPEMQAKGVNVAIKHFAANDQETNRTGVSTFMTEQALREGPLKGFEGGITEGGAMGIMTSFNRFGCTFVGHSSALQNDVLRGEWGFEGVIITDACGSRYYIHTIDSLVNGSDMYCMATKSRANEIVARINGQGDGYILQRLRDANKHFFYAFSRSNLINGLSSAMRVEIVYPWWKATLIAIDIVIGLTALGCIAMLVLNKTIFCRTKRKSASLD